MFFFLSPILFSPADLMLIKESGIRELELVLFLYDEWTFLPIQELPQAVITGEGSIVDRFLRTMEGEGLAHCYGENCLVCGDRY